MPLDIAQLASRLIAVRSFSGEEGAVVKVAKEMMEELGWSVQSFPVADGRDNLFVSFGSPRVLYTTHLDIVPAPSALFSPRLENGVLYGRGACDAKGIAATMIAAVYELQKQGASDIGLLFVVGEEVDGIGAKQAAKDLKTLGVSYLVNGEPTEGKLVLAHKGHVDFELVCTGRACHSGYPELGVDANQSLLKALNRLNQIDFGNDPLLGRGTLNIGLIKGGVAQNIISPKATVTFSIRTVGDSEPIVAMVNHALSSCGALRLLSVTEPQRMMSLPGFETGIAAYCTDISHFAPLNAQAILYGPGSILDAHTDGEKIAVEDLYRAVTDYQRIYECLKDSETIALCRSK